MLKSDTWLDLSTTYVWPKILTSSWVGGTYGDTMKCGTSLETIGNIWILSALGEETLARKITTTSH